MHDDPDYGGDRLPPSCDNGAWLTEHGHLTFEDACETATDEEVEIAWENYRNDLDCDDTIRRERRYR